MATPIADMVEQMLSTGIPPDMIVLAVRTAELAQPVADQTAENRRRWDRERKRRKKSGGIPLSGSSLPSSSIERPTLEKEERLEIVAPELNEFAVFWNRYPHKVGKRAAATAFERARRRAGFDIITAGLARYAAKIDDRPWCNPATWLNQDRWDDQPGPAQEGNGKARPAPQKASVLDFAAGFDARTRMQLAERAEIERQRRR